MRHKWMGLQSQRRYTLLSHVSRHLAIFYWYLDIFLSWNAKRLTRIIVDKYNVIEAINLWKTNGCNQEGNILHYKYWLVA